MFKTTKEKNWKCKLNCGLSSQMLKKKLKNLKNCPKITKKSLFFPLFGKKSFLNQTIGLRKAFLNQTTYVLKNRLHQQPFLNRDSFLNRAFLNRECTVLTIVFIFNFVLYFLRTERLQLVEETCVIAFFPG